MFKGRALLVIDRLESRLPTEFRWDIGVHQFTCNHDDPGGEVNEMFSCVEYDCTPAPDAAYNMGIGDRIYVLVHFEIEYTRGDGWMTDDDADMYYVRQRVLKRQPYNERRARKRDYAGWKSARAV